MFIYSTASNDQKFNLFKPTEKGGVPVVAGFVIIKGRANVANRNRITEKGVMTQISDEQWELLQQVNAYKDMAKNGYMHHDSKRLDPAVAAEKNLEAKDKSAPLTPKDAEKAGVDVHNDGDVAV